MKKILRILYCLLVFILSASHAVCATRTSDGAAMIKQGASSGEILVTVLPVVNADENDKSNFVITKSIISGLLESGFIDVVPYRVMIEHIWQFYPDFFEVNPAKVAANPNDVDFYGNLELIEKQHLAPVIGSDYMIDGIYSPEDQKALICEVFSRKENRIVISFTAELDNSGSVLDETAKICSKLIKYFFELNSDDFVFQEVRTLSAQRSSSPALEKWESLYPDNLFVLSGLMVYYKNYSYSPDKLVAAGEKWFAQHDVDTSGQIRFFKSLNFNPYYVLGNEYIKQQKYDKAIDVLRVGEKTFPFNSEELKNEFILCLRLLGKHDEAELIEKKK